VSQPIVLNRKPSKVKIDENQKLIAQEKVRKTYDAAQI
jgi:hypothetical protein